jgi:hypothetical protein
MEVASWCLYLVTKPSHMGGLGGWASLPHAPANGRWLPAKGTWPTRLASSCLVIVVGGGAFRGKGSFPGVDI